MPVFGNILSSWLRMGTYSPLVSAHFLADTGRLRRTLPCLADERDGAGRRALPQRGAPAQSLPGQHRAAAVRAQRWRQRAAGAAHGPAAEPQPGRDHLAWQWQRASKCWPTARLAPHQRGQVPAWFSRLAGMRRSTTACRCRLPGGSDGVLELHYTPDLPLLSVWQAVRQQALLSAVNITLVLVLLGLLLASHRRAAGAAGASDRAPARRRLHGAHGRRRHAGSATPVARLQWHGGRRGRDAQLAAGQPAAAGRSS